MEILRGLKAERGCIGAAICLLIVHCLVLASSASADDPRVGAASVAEASVFETRKLELPDVGFSVELPVDWTIKPPESGPFAAVVELPPRRALGLLTRAPILSGDSETAGLDRLLDELPRAFSHYDVLLKDRRSLTPGLAGYVLEVQGTARGRTLHHTTYLIEGFGERFNLTFACEASEHAELASQFERIAASLRLRGPNPHSAEFLDLIKTAPHGLAALEALLESGADINATDSDGLNALAAAVFSGNGKLTQWLLKHGADPSRPQKVASLLPMVASPAIYELLVRADPKLRSEITPEKQSSEHGLSIHWVSAEAQLFAGIKRARIKDVQEALRSGADLHAVEPRSGLAALSLTRKMIKEFEQLDLDPSRFHPIEELLANAQDSVDPEAQSSLVGSEPSR